MFNTILYIEDDKLAQTLNEIYFKESGFCKNVINLSSGRQALNFFERIVNGEELIENMPEIIFLDINMPVMNAWDFLDLFETKFPQFVMTIPIFILTSSIDPEDKKRAENHKSVLCLFEKPLDFEHIKTARRHITNS